MPKAVVGLAQAHSGQLLGLVTALHLISQLMQYLTERW
jgi:uncharacterized protein involved in propanediol utilization